MSKLKNILSSALGKNAEDPGGAPEGGAPGTADTTPGGDAKPKNAFVRTLDDIRRGGGTLFISDAEGQIQLITDRRQELDRSDSTVFDTMDLLLSELTNLAQRLVMKLKQDVSGDNSKLIAAVQKHRTLLTQHQRVVKEKIALEAHTSEQIARLESRLFNAKDETIREVKIGVLRKLDDLADATKVRQLRMESGENPYASTACSHCFEKYAVPEKTSNDTAKQLRARCDLLCEMNNLLGIQLRECREYLKQTDLLLAAPEPGGKRGERPPGGGAHRDPRAAMRGGPNRGGAKLSISVQEGFQLRRSVGAVKRQLGLLRKAFVAMVGEVSTGFVKFPHVLHEYIEDYLGGISVGKHHSIGIGVEEFVHGINKVTQGSRFASKHLPPNQVLSQQDALLMNLKNIGKQFAYLLSKFDSSMEFIGTLPCSFDGSSSTEMRIAVELFQHNFIPEKASGADGRPASSVSIPVAFSASGSLIPHEVRNDLAPPALRISNDDDKQVYTMSVGFSYSKSKRGRLETEILEAVREELTSGGPAAEGEGAPDVSISLIKRKVHLDTVTIFAKLTGGGFSLSSAAASILLPPPCTEPHTQGLPHSPSQPAGLEGSLHSGSPRDSSQGGTDPGSREISEGSGGFHCTSPALSCLCTPVVLLTPVVKLEGKRRRGEVAGSDKITREDLSLLREAHAHSMNFMGSLVTAVDFSAQGGLGVLGEMGETAGAPQGAPSGGKTARGGASAKSSGSAQQGKGKGGARGAGGKGASGKPVPPAPGSAQAGKSGAAAKGLGAAIQQRLYVVSLSARLASVAGAVASAVLCHLLCALGTDDESILLHLIFPAPPTPAELQPQLQLQLQPGEDQASAGLSHLTQVNQGVAHIEVPEVAQRAAGGSSSELLSLGGGGGVQVGKKGVAPPQGGGGGGGGVGVGTSPLAGAASPAAAVKKRSCMTMTLRPLRAAKSTQTVDPAGVGIPGGVDSELILSPFTHPEGEGVPFWEACDRSNDYNLHLAAHCGVLFSRDTDQDVFLSDDIGSSHRRTSHAPRKTSRSPSRRLSDVGPPHAPHSPHSTSSFLGEPDGSPGGTSPQGGKRKGRGRGRGKSPKGGRGGGSAAAATASAAAQGQGQAAVGVEAAALPEQRGGGAAPRPELNGLPLPPAAISSAAPPPGLSYGPRGGGGGGAGVGVGAGACPRTSPHHPTSPGSAPQPPPGYTVASSLQPGRHRSQGPGPTPHGAPAPGQAPPHHPRHPTSGTPGAPLVSRSLMGYAAGESGGYAPHAADGYAGAASAGALSSPSSGESSHYVEKIAGRSVSVALQHDDLWSWQASWHAAVGEDRGRPAKYFKEGAAELLDEAEIHEGLIPLHIGQRVQILGEDALQPIITACPALRWDGVYLKLCGLVGTVISTFSYMNLIKVHTVRGSATLPQPAVVPINEEGFRQDPVGRMTSELEALKHRAMMKDLALHALLRRHYTDPRTGEAFPVDLQSLPMFAFGRSAPLLNPPPVCCATACQTEESELAAMSIGGPSDYTLVPQEEWTGYHDPAVSTPASMGGGWPRCHPAPPGGALGGFTGRQQMLLTALRRDTQKEQLLGIASSSMLLAAGEGSGAADRMVLRPERPGSGHVTLVPAGANEIPQGGDGGAVCREKACVRVQPTVVSYSATTTILPPCVPPKRAVGILRKKVVPETRALDPSDPRFPPLAGFEGNRVVASSGHRIGPADRSDWSDDND